MYTAIQTSQLQRIPRTKATSNGRLHLPVAMATDAGAFPRVPDLKARYAKISEPMKLPEYEAIQFLRSDEPSVFPYTSKKFSSSDEGHYQTKWQTESTEDHLRSLYNLIGEADTGKIIMR